jgi:two-component system sensor histidine kinase RpfC
VLSYATPAATLFNALHASRAYDAAAEPGVVQVEPWVWRQSRQPKPRVLIADDNRTNLMILGKILEKANYDVDAAENGEQALEMLLNTRYKIAVLDMHMPGFDGIDVVKQYRLIRSGARTPVVMLTANATMSAKLESAEAGADAYLTKPATASALISTIRKLLDDTEVHELKFSETVPLTTRDTPILDTQLIAELDRLYSDPNEVDRLLDTFEQEGRRLLDGLKMAIAAKNHARVYDVIHALKGNAANIGALRLAQACQEVERDFAGSRKERAAIVSGIESAFIEAAQALREFTVAGESKPARRSDSH